MNVIEAQIKKIQEEKRMGLMTHVVIGYPSLTLTRELVCLMAEEGVDFIELQIPFSDPLGDGSIIRQANEEALLNGVRVIDTFKLVTELVKNYRVAIPILLMSYFNIPFTYGLEKFCCHAQESGVNGLIVPDYNPDAEIHEHFKSYASKYDQTLIRFVAPCSTPERMKLVAESSEGFVYCFLAQSVTGANKVFDRDVFKYLKEVRNNFKLPLATGFGIFEAKQLEYLRVYADIVVVGSALLRQFQSGGLSAVRKKVRELKAVL